MSKNNKPKLRKIVSTDILPLIHNYLVQIGLDSVAKKLQKKSGIDFENNDTPFANKKLQKVVKFYVTNHKEMIKNFIVNENEEQENNWSEQEEEYNQTQKKGKAQKDKKKKQNEKKQEELEEESEQEQKPQKKHKKNNKNDTDNEIETQNEQQLNQQEEQIQEEEQKEQKPQGRKYFQKCDDSKLQFLPPQLADNSHEAKAKFGKGDLFGDVGYQRLKEVRGRNFRKEKDKLKNKNFCGGNFSIDINAVNSIPI